MSMHYLHEPRRGIPLARNALVEAALKAAVDALIFIDDDEQPKPTWLAELLSAHERLGADVILAPVHPEFEPGTPQWILKGRFFDRPMPPEGTTLSNVNTGNILVASSVFDRVGRFDETLQFNGGSDTHFFMRAKLAGVSMRFTRTAEVYESIPATRANTAWIVQRAFRLGNGYASLERMLLPASQWLLLRSVKIVAKYVIGTARLLMTPIFGRTMAVHGLRDLARAAGASASLMGFHYEEYRMIHGR